MGIKTKIQWCDSTVNPTAGCEGCELWRHGVGGSCYAAAIHNRFAGRNPAYPQPFEVVETRPGRMAIAARWKDLRGTERPDKPWLNSRPRHIFIGDMGDVFCEQIPLKYLRDEMIANVASWEGSRQIWIVLTKRVTNMSNFGFWLHKQGMIWPENLITMTTATNQDSLMPRINSLLLFADSKRRGVSCEPLLGPIDLQPYLRGLEWVIAGGESGRGARPANPDHVRSLRDQCADAGVPFFFKAWGPRGAGRLLDGREHNQMLSAVVSSQ